jgi:hypothetical protein
MTDRLTTGRWLLVAGCWFEGLAKRIGVPVESLRSSSVPRLRSLAEKGAEKGRSRTFRPSLRETTRILKCVLARDRDATQSMRCCRFGFPANDALPHTDCFSPVLKRPSVRWQTATLPNLGAIRARMLGFFLSLHDLHSKGEAMWVWDRSRRGTSRFDTPLRVLVAPIRGC